MGRGGGGGGRSSGGGRRSYSTPRRAPTPRNPPPAARPASSSNPPAPAPASSSSVVGSAVAHAASAVADGWLWGAGSAMAHRAMDFFMGPREFKIEHTTSAAASTTTAQAQQQGPCDIHAQAFQDCINHNGTDISRCQFYVDVLNDCRRRGQVAVVQASG